MRAARPEKIARYSIPSKVISKTQRFFRQQGRKGKEAIGYWTGTFVGNEAHVLDTLFPNKFVKKDPKDSWGHARVDLDTAFRVGQEIRKREQFLLVQLHTHPSEAFHSCIDDRFPISHRLEFISIVIPFFAKYPLNDQHMWKVYEYLGEGKWRELDTSEIASRFIIT